VIWLGESYGLLVVNDKAPAKTLPELIKLAKEIMDKVTEIYAKVVKSANIKAE
jgi:tripartite-type tricarboxylate transporter receptor subunit TctC